MHPDARLVAESLSGDARAIRALVDLLSPVIHARVGRILFSRFGKERDLKEASADATQEVFAMLFADEAKVLRSWNPQQGLSLANFIGLVAERNALANLRAGSRTAARERAATDDELHDVAGSISGPESPLMRRITFEAVVARVEAELTDQARRLFELVYVEDRSIPSICDELGMNADAVYAWRSRLLKTVRRVATELEAGSGPPDPASPTAAAGDAADE